MPQSTDDQPTLAAIGLLAYASADVAHHALGHGVGCLALGGRVESLSSIRVICSLTGAAIDLCGPAANLLLGLACLATMRTAACQLSTRSPARGALHLLLVLTMAFNLCWFGAQAAFSAITLTDDWAWPLHLAGHALPARAAVFMLGAAVYGTAVRGLARHFARLGWEPRRVRTATLAAWLAAGTLACATALADPGGARALSIAAAQAMLLPVGMLFAGRRRSASTAGNAAVPIARQPACWAVAAIATIASTLCLGPGIAIAISDGGISVRAASISFRTSPAAR